MDIGIISSRYAKALFSLAKEKGQESRVYEDMKMLANSFSEEPGLEDAINNPIIPADEKFKLLITAGGVEVSDLYKRFIHLLLEHKRENFLLFMAHVYIHLYREDKRITRVLFSTAVPVNDEVKEHLQNKLKEETGSTIEFSGIVQPELIGGFRLRIGNYRIDAIETRQHTNETSPFFPFVLRRCTFGRCSVCTESRGGIPLYGRAGKLQTANNYRRLRYPLRRSVLRPLCFRDGRSSGGNPPPLLARTAAAAA